MKRGSKIVLFIAVAAITFGSLNYFIGRRGYCGNGFRNQHERPWQDNKPAGDVPTQRI